MGTIRKFEDLEIWKQARILAKRIFQLYSSSPSFSKDFKLRDQINASSGSVMDNIAEGFDRGSRNEFVNFLSISKGSIGELKSQLYRAFDREHITKEILNEVYEIADNLGARIGSFIKYLNRSNFKGVKFKERSSIEKGNSKQ